MPLKLITFFLYVALVLGIVNDASAQRTLNQMAGNGSKSTVGIADLDGDGRADVVFCDLDGDGLTDVVSLSSGNARGSVISSSAKGQSRPAPQPTVADLDGDGSPESVKLSKTGEVRTINDAPRSLLSQIRRELRDGSIGGVDAMIAKGWLALTAAGGDPLSHVIAGGPKVGGSGPAPVPYPDPENPGAGSGNGGTGSPAGGGGIPMSVGDDAGVSKGVITRPVPPPPG